MSKHLLIVSHSQSGNTKSMLDAVYAGATDEEVTGVEVRTLQALDAGVDAVQWAEGIILGTPENFGYMSGALKYFFDEVYYPCLEKTRGLPYALFVKAGNDGSGAVASVQRIVAGLAWREALPPLVVQGELQANDLEICREFGMTLAAGLEMGIF